MVTRYDRPGPQRFGYLNRISNAHGVANFIAADGNHQDVWARDPDPLVETHQRIAEVHDDAVRDLKHEPLAVAYLRQSGTADDGSIRLGDQSIGVPVMIRVHVRNHDVRNGTPDVAWDDWSEAEVVELAAGINMLLGKLWTTVKFGR